MKIIDYLQGVDNEEKLAFLVCCNEYDLPNFDNININKCIGSDWTVCKQCWEYALGNTLKN